jgi:dephospho-CoA kinase
MIIIGITGHIGAGKGTVVEYLKNIKGFKHFSARSFITKEVIKRNLPVDRDSMTLVSNELRKEHSPSFIIESLYKEAKEDGVDCIIESIRTVGEVDALRSIGHFFLLAVTADLAVRYERIVLRASATDNISFDTFIEQDERESSSSDPHKQNINACISKADFVLNNNGSIEVLHKEIEKVFETISSDSATA